MRFKSDARTGVLLSEEKNEHIKHHYDSPQLSRKI